MAKIGRQEKKELEQEGKDLASRCRRELGLGIEPISDIFGLIERFNVILLRYPSDNPKLSAFITKNLEGYTFIYLNTKRTLGHQIFSAAHEFKHLLYDKDLNARICNPEQDQNDPSEIVADAFAGAFLMPLDGVRSIWRECFGNDKCQFITPKHVIKMQQIFHVSYSAILNALLQAEIISRPIYGKLRKMASPEHADALKTLTRKMGYSTSLIEETSPEIPRILIESLHDNYEKGLVSFGKVKYLLSLWNKTPNELGFEPYYD
ncbi:hypothetical protein E308F_17010 [Moorella sp. E308F]|uniref:ImmA/IrrE family metallo-endopeptidase n=1 Tax=unclassified Neomoorella TaxID=2676739 RepID=UPI0010FFC31C|nr:MULTISPECIES: ImmA/IrrE family metallo-endopeptidase [unclassified Moorella (in: firmicutes)]GEA15457.1 hypothetical protein E308F_17010 [Moorella sp. E308F]GEA19685.1 hypothetical protein E306M_28230 [Moorella sp. E306M]